MKDSLISKKPKERYHVLDYLRGICALGIMVYHYSYWILGKYTGNEFMGRVGVYCVSMFYILSGLTLFLVYEKRLKGSILSIKSFIIKRVFRIFPLMWLVLGVYLIGNWQNVNLYWYVMTFTGAFGLLDWNIGLPLGMWSIGNELVFYIAFPFLLFATLKNKLTLLVCALIVFGIYIAFAFYGYNQYESIKNAAHIYSNPFNQVGLFYMGMLIAYIFKNKNFSIMISMSLLITALLILILYPTDESILSIVKGWARLIFSLSCGLMTLSIFKLKIRTPKRVHQVLSLLGGISYSVYLIHPIVWELFNFSFIKVRYTLIISSILTFIISYFIYKIVEMPIRDFGRKLVQ